MFFQSDISTSINSIGLGAIFTILLGYIDFLFYGITQYFFILLGARVLFLVFSIFLIRFIQITRKEIQPKQLEIKIMLWYFALATLLLSVDFGRPPSYIQNQSLYILVIFCYYTVIQIPLRSRILPAVFLTISGLVILFFIKDPMPIQSINMIVTLQLLTHVLGFQIAKQTLVNRIAHYSLFQQKETALKEMDQLAKHDGLTGLINRRQFDEVIDKEYQRFIRLREPFCILSLDIDHFKTINDQYGHAAGDEVLRKLSKVLHDNARSMDVVGRVGGEEFAVLCPGLKLDSGFSIGERMRKVCEEMVVLIDTNTISVSVSVGVTEVHPNDNDIEGILRRADVALYLAKTSGRNRVVLNEYDSMPNSAV